MSVLLTLEMSSLFHKNYIVFLTSTIIGDFCSSSWNKSFENDGMLQIFLNENIIGICTGQLFCFSLKDLPIRVSSIHSPRYLSNWFEITCLHKSLYTLVYGNFIIT